MSSAVVYTIQKTYFTDFINSLAREYRAFYLKSDKTSFGWKESKRKLLYWQEYKGDWEGLTLGEVRAQDPLKQFVFSSKEKVAEDFQGISYKAEKPILLIGAKNCDLSGLAITDFVFLQGDFQDPFYINKRQSMFIIASDCSGPNDICFCTALGLKPYPENNYDMSVSDIGESYLVEVVSDKARKYAEHNRGKFELATDSQLKKRLNLRGNTINQVEKNAQNNAVPQKLQLDGIMKKGFE